LAPQLLRLAHDLNIAERVRLVPRTVTGVDKEAMFAAAQVLVLPSHSESFGNAVLEAMQRGVPVIVTPEVGSADTVRVADAGLVVEGAPEPLGAAIERLAADPALARSMGEAGRRHVREHYRWASVAARMEALYAGLRS
jgi:glycosyltransferase involved in cell wall biosynthesis